MKIKIIGIFSGSIDLQLGQLQSALKQYTKGLELREGDHRDSEE